MKLFLYLICLFLTRFAVAQPAITYQTLATGFTQPVDLVHAGDDRLFIVERGGTIKILKDNAVLATPFLDISDKTSTDGDRGLLSMAFHPDYKTNGYFFVYYTERTSGVQSSGAITIARYTVSADSNNADTESEVILFRLEKPLSQAGTTFLDHNGGDLNFGKDGYLYFGTGDGGKEGGMEAPGDPYNNSQNEASPLGKFIRLNVNATPGTVDTTIIAKGLRNPWRWSFDRQTGDVWIGDVGHYKWEEVHYLKNKGSGASTLQLNSGLNLGWPCYEADERHDSSHCPPAALFDFPVFKYSNERSTGGPPASITGGYVYRGERFPGLQGYYINADLYSGTVHFIKPDGAGGWSTHTQPGLEKGIVTFGEDKGGELYAASIFSGTIYKVIYTGPITALPDVTSPGAPASLLYPNPVQHTLTLQWGDVLVKPGIHITNATGALVATNLPYKLSSRAIVMNVAALKAGVYYLHLKTKKHTQTFTFIKQ